MSSIVIHLPSNETVKQTTNKNNDLGLDQTKPEGFEKHTFFGALLTRMYNGVMALARHRHATPWLAAVSFAESSFFPIPPDIMLIPMVLADRARWWRVAAVCTVASVLGGLAGYAIGAVLWETIGLPLIDFYGYAGKMETFVGHYNEWGAWIVFTAGLTPIPYKVITIASGVSGFGPAGER